MSDFRVSPDGLTPLVDDESQSSEDTAITIEQIPDILKNSGFKLDELFKLCVTFYKGKLDKIIDYRVYIFA